MRDAKIKIGILGAGGNTINKHIPLLQNISEVEIVSVCNRSLTSSQKVCEQFNIPGPVAHPDQILKNSDIDAIVIGTWPYKHCEFSIAGLENNKHVLTEARMAMNSQEAQRMLSVSKAHPDLIAQVVPAPFTLTYDEIVSEYVKNKLGKLISVQCTIHSGDFPIEQPPFSWRHDTALSGNNVMGVGIFYESMVRWFGPLTSLTAQTQIHQKQRFLADGTSKQTEIPDLVQILGILEHNKAHFSMLFTAFCGGHKISECWLYGSEAALKVDFSGKLFFTRKGASALEEIKIQDFNYPGWRVEEEFINAIQGKEKIKRTTFEAGLHYMKVTDAIKKSAENGQRINI